MCQVVQGHNSAFMTTARGKVTEITMEEFVMALDKLYRSWRWRAWLFIVLTLLSLPMGYLGTDTLVFQLEIWKLIRVYRACYAYYYAYSKCH